MSHLPTMSFVPIRGRSAVLPGDHYPRPPSSARLCGALTSLTLCRTTSLGRVDSRHWLPLFARDLLADSSYRVQRLRGPSAAGQDRSSHEFGGCLLDGLYAASRRRNHGQQLLMARNKLIRIGLLDFEFCQSWILFSSSSLVNRLGDCLHSTRYI